MRVFRKPVPPLDQFVDIFWACEEAVQPHNKERVLPTGCVELVINLWEDQTRIYDRSDFKLSQSFGGCVVVGPQTEFCIIDTAEQTSVVGIHFKPGGAYPFFAPPVDELHGLQIPLDDLWGRLARELRERLLEARAAEQRLGILENALLSRVKGPLERHGAVAFALQQFERNAELQSVQAVTDRTGLSARRFIELFRRETGFTPKSFCRVRRFQRALERIARGVAVEWAEVALDAGYFDQAHFIHDFRAFSGINPSAYLASPRRHMNHVPLAE